MSCGKAHETDCSEVLEEVWLFLDRECDAERRQLLKQHLDECHPCLEKFGIEEHLKELLARKCGGEQAPDRLKERLRASLRGTVREQYERTVRYGGSGGVVEYRSATSVEIDQQY